MVRLDLVRDRYHHFYYYDNYLYGCIKNLDCFFEKHDDLNNLSFAKKVMMGKEIQANNNIEGIKDDLKVVDKAIHKLWGDISCDEKIRIINLYHGYKYILQKHDISKNSLRELYNILSCGLLDDYSLNHMGEYYRKGPVYIFGRDIIDFDVGVPNQFIDNYMNCFFHYVHDDMGVNDSISSFIKSQIIHLYFVYIHPFFDVNGRTARTVSLWYLLNHDNYSFVVFNRAIAYYRQKYLEYVSKSCHNGNLTNFLQYMLMVVLRELEREYLVRHICSNSNTSLTMSEEQMLEYFFMIRGKVTLKKLMGIYYHYNPRIKFKDIYYDRVITLIDKGIFIKEGDFNAYMVLKLNKKYIDVDGKEFKHIKLKNR